ncbi:hypothetical protein [Ideonella sp. BN130291]|uniref:hypothetical protein n=1 Tax=Ideonella sp. BN130291 TaxID=3112940 RepID=UPI002E257F05|nr:hypothetical protein [Ideonella sp. BN130291]
MSPMSRVNLSTLQRVLIDGSLASVLSGVVLAWRGRRETGHAMAPLNAPSHWVWGREALHRNRTSLRYTALGSAIHHASSLMWAGFYRLLQARRRQPTPASAVLDAAVITAAAALVDLRLVPQRFTPGFERRLSTPALVSVYLSFGVGLVLGGLMAQRRR